MGAFQTRQVVVMEADTPGSRLYAAGNTGNHHVAPELPLVTLAEDVWHDMGKPETITVTIEVGDTLNPDARREDFQHTSA